MNRLYRSRHDRMLAGVCGGLGEHFGVDSSLIRLGLVLLIVFGGTGFLAYLIAWVVIPEEPYDYQEYREKKELHVLKVIQDVTQRLKMSLLKQKIMILM